ncbi:methyl-accepting chemotaxis protein [Janthinobacterium agaricidamnosum]|uniref:Methyl-accepting chemotaxis (MCP) signaling domain protein n=1 Tax=Janthinobacterium agaricidamnosum NBRC 102515 = DSM 9628 TaxID=1349767 RepID=W0V1G6_9BURK|nr:methyl-accepting chemotaxis protein [Janthinobacterium agaricidamnosum]CDG81430.1 methyl-accepting chemotaxis (MCP) signaling domain protein [Janthinobacterium agaricidamnosum NBRC 102515 = DSM 9628]
MAADAEILSTPILQPPSAAPSRAPSDTGLDGDVPLRLRDALGSMHRRAANPAPAKDLKMPLIGHLPLQKQLSILSSVLALSLAASLLFVGLNTRSSAILSAQTQLASDALMHSQRVGKAAPNAVQGNLDAFRQLEESRNELNQDLNLMARGGNYQGRAIGETRTSLLAAVADARKKWTSSDRAAHTILRMKNELAGFDKTLQQLNALSPALLAQTEDIAALRAQRGGNVRDMAVLGRLMMLTQRMSRSASEFLGSGGISSETAFMLGRDTTYFRSAIDGFLNGSVSLQLTPVRDPETRAKLDALKTSFDAYQKLVSSILDRLDRFTAAKSAEQLIFNENEEVRQRLALLQQTYRNDQESLGWEFWLMVVSVLLTLVAAAGIGRVLLQDSVNRTRGADRRRREAEAQRLESQRKEEEAQATNDMNQAAILRLMNELQKVADGDLTVHATVSEDITGAIADSVNYTVEELRGLVGRVTATAEQVNRASTQAQSISSNLLSASQQQSREIQDASATVMKMAHAITDVSKSASESADVARQSVAAARQGSTAVENAIKGMHEIRDQIQETSKRIKRLGESSQEIGEITELISDITEQTNVLALNAAIQAASAGEAGRGFSVVAEEVQRLAERSAGAAKQIGALVRTIQTDTHDAVAAMEKSTHGVVEGARLSDAAGAALSDISQVSNRLAELIQGMSYATGMQATSANGVALNIQHILSVTEQTQDGTKQTAQSIHKLSVLAQELKNSVSRFRVVA